MMKEISAVSEYDCWFQRREHHFSAEMIETLSRMRVESPGERSGILARAAGEYRLCLYKVFGIIAADGAAETENRGVVIGTAAWMNRTFGTAFPAQNAEGFIIRAGEERILIAGQDAPGCLYGVYRFIALLAAGKIAPGAEFAEAPAAPIRMINHWDNLDGTIERGYAGLSLFYRDNRFDYDPRRIEDYARLLASVGINRISINNVNVRGAARLLITEEYLPEAAKLAAIFRPFGIRIMLCVNFAAPYSSRELDTADPLNPEVAEWWKRRAGLVYRWIPDMAGFLVKADSEGEPGPFQYGRTHADGANMLASALAPHDGEVIWRCFVYNCSQDWRDHSVDRARAAYDHFMPLDGKFSSNALLQIKFGPYDFQVREPVSPLFGALRKTRHLLELQITQEYTGHQIDLCYLPWMWEDVMRFDTARGERARIGDLVGSEAPGGISGMAAVANVGLDRNWTGHTLAQANLYGYGRLAWNPALGAGDIAAEWSALTFTGAEAAGAVSDILLKSYPAYEKYNAPFGVCFMVTPGLHYGPNIEGYEFSRWGTYHRADRESIGIDRTPAGTGYTSQYAEKNAALFADPGRCPENLLLFFHRLRYDFKMKNGETLLQNIYNTHFEGYDEVQAMLDRWVSIKNLLGEEVYAQVLSRLERQLANAREWRDQINTYFWRKTGVPDMKGRTIYE
jgi:alpha-glucuronidase